MPHLSPQDAASKTEPVPGPASDTTSAQVTLEDVRAAFEAVSLAERENDPRRAELHKRALLIFRMYNDRFNMAMQSAARQQIELITRKIADAKGETLKVLQEKLRIWEGVLMDATVSMARNASSEKAERPGKDEQAA